MKTITTIAIAIATLSLTACASGPAALTKDVANSYTQFGVALKNTEGYRQEGQASAQNTASLDPSDEGIALATTVNNQTHAYSNELNGYVMRASYLMSPKGRNTADL